MPTPYVKSTFDLIGLVAYFTVMMGRLPDKDLLTGARQGVGPREVSLPARNEAEVERAVA